MSKVPCWAIIMMQLDSVAQLVKTKWYGSSFIYAFLEDLGSNNVVATIHVINPADIVTNPTDITESLIRANLSFLIFLCCLKTTSGLDI